MSMRRWQLACRRDVGAAALHIEMSQWQEQPTARWPAQGPCGLRQQGRQEDQDEIVKTRKKNGHPRAESDVLSTRVPPNSSPQYVKEMTTWFGSFSSSQCLHSPKFAFDFLFVTSGCSLPNFRQAYTPSSQRRGWKQSRSESKEQLVRRRAKNRHNKAGNMLYQTQKGLILPSSTSRQKEV